MCIKLAGKGNNLDNLLNELQFNYSIYPLWIRIIKLMYPSSTFEIAFDDVFEDIITKCASKHKFIRKYEDSDEIL